MFLVKIICYSVFTFFVITHSHNAFSNDEDVKEVIDIDYYDKIQKDLILISEGIQSGVIESYPFVNSDYADQICCVDHYTCEKAAEDFIKMVSYCGVGAWSTTKGIGETATQIINSSQTLNSFLMTTFRLSPQAAAGIGIAIAAGGCYMGLVVAKAEIQKKIDECRANRNQAQLEEFLIYLNRIDKEIQSLS